ncbi:MAG TPA: hypothetical protein VGI39_41745 [Polyangiaceae bacterium]|jgi:hypothetical protein
MKRRLVLSSALAGLASVLVAGAAGATPTFQVINTIAVPTTQVLQTPYGFASSAFAGAPTYDRDPTEPWLIDLTNQFTPGSGSFTRVGAVGASPTTTVTPDVFSAPGEAHPASVIVAMSDSYVYRVDAQTGECVWKTYIGRTTAATINFPGCTGEVPAEEIQCPNEPTGAVTFLSGTVGSDAASTLFFIPTDYDQVAAGDDPPECGTLVDNRLYALNAADGAPAWVFNVDLTSPTPFATNETPPYPVAGIVGDIDNDTGLWDECATVARNRLIFGTIDPGTGQDTLYSIYTDTPGTPGQVEWSANEGDIQAPLFPAWGRAATCGHLYTTTTDGNLHALGTTVDSCGGSAPPCELGKKQPVFLGSNQLGFTQMFWDTSSPLFGKLLVASEATISVLDDQGAGLLPYCTAATVQSKFPTLTSVPTPLGSNLWFGANDRLNNGAVVSLAVPTTAPKAPFDCGSAITSFAQKGTVGDIDSDINMATGARVLYAAVNGSQGSSVVVANYSN